LTRRVLRHPLLMLALLAAGALALPTDAPARNSKASLGDVIKASRLLYQQRIAEARAAVGELVRKSPNLPEVRWLAAELAFHEGRYQDAVNRLSGLADDAVDGRVGQTRRLAASTLQVTTGFVERKSANGRFVILYPPGPDEVIVDLAAEALEAAYHAIGDDLGWRPSEPVRVELLSDPADLAKLSPLSELEIETTGTIALSKYNKLMVVSPRATLSGYPWLDTLCHEYVHLAVSSISHDSVPVWLQEGLARYLQERWRRAGGARLPAVDQQLLSSALKNRRLIDLDDMHPSMAKLPSQEAAALAYAEVLTLVEWLHAKVGWEGIRKVLSLQRDGKSAPRAVAEVLDTSWAKVSKQWKAHLRTLDLSAGKTLAGKAEDKRIRFDKGGQADDNVGVDAVASARARKHARIGGMMRARSMLEAAALEYEKALSASPGDPFVTGKLARTYVELGEYGQAAALARPLAQLDEHDPVPAVTLGVALAAAGDAQGAREAFEQALRVSPFDPAVRCGLADAYGKLADGRAARERQACDRLRR
jgi:Flp pilus assembly protein TadD